MNPWSKFKQSWHPKPITPPEVDPDFHQLDSLTRSAESIRYSLLSIEWWISKNGLVREWLRHITQVAAYLIIPAVLVVPVITFLLLQLVKWSTMLNSMSRHLMVFPILALVAAIALRVVLNIVKTMLK